MLLVGALICGGAFLIPILDPASQYWAFRPEMLMMLVPPLQYGGVVGMRAYLAARGVAAKWPLRIGFVAAVAWLVAMIGGALAQAAGPGGLVLGMFVLLPAALIGLFGIVIAFVGFVQAEGRVSA